MSDPVTVSIQLALQAVRTGAAVARWWNSRQPSGGANPSGGTNPSGAPATVFNRQGPDDLLYVVSTVGQWMFSLDVVNIDVLPAAHAATRQAFQAGDPEEDDIGYSFSLMDIAVQYAATAGMVFCAECWPMHIWRGFGCGIFNDLTWADPHNCNIFCAELDTSIAALKSQPHQWQLFKKSPSAISKTEPSTVPSTKWAVRKGASAAKDVFEAFEKKGFPQPRPPYSHIMISNWWIPFATWNGTSMYESEAHRPGAIAQYQCDPGRFLWAWTAGKQGHPKPGEGLLLVQSHIGHLAQWLEGLNGVQFKVLLDTEVDFSHLRFSRSVHNLFMKLHGNLHGITGEAFVMVYDPRLVDYRRTSAQLIPHIQNLQINPSQAASHPKPPVSPISVGFPTTPSTRPPRAGSQAASPQGPSQATFPVAQPSSPLPADFQVPSPSSPPHYFDIVQNPMPNASSPAAHATKRRSVPQPPAAAKKTVKALHDFFPESEEEMAFRQGDVLEILDDTAADGWWTARLYGKTGVIPRTFVADYKEERSPLVKRPAMVPVTAVGLYPITPPASAADMVARYEYFGPDASASPNQSASNEEVSHYGHPMSFRAPLSPASPINYHFPSAPRVMYNAPQHHQTYQPAPSIPNSPPVAHPTPQHDQLSQARPGLSNINNSSNQIDQFVNVRSVLHGHSKSVQAVCFSPGGSILASGSEDSSVRLWDPNTGSFLNVLNGHGSGVHDLDFMPDGNALASAASDSTVKLWDMRSRATCQTLDQTSAAFTVAASPNGKMLATGLYNNKIQIWDTRSLSVLHMLAEHKSMIRSLAFSSNGTTLASSSNDKTVKLWDPYPVAFSPDGQILASGALDGNIKLWNPYTGELLQTLRVGSQVNDIAFSSDGTVIAAATVLKGVVFWSINGTEIYSTSGLKKKIECLSFSSDSTLLATGADDKVVKVWKMSSSFY